MNTAPLTPPRRHRSDAFTLVELAVVIAILVAISAVSFPSLVRSFEEQKLRQAAIELQSKLLRARTLAQRLQGNCGVTVTSTGVRAATSADGFSGTNVCTTTTLTTLNLQAVTNVRGLAISNSNANQTGCSGGCNLVFIPLGVLVGTPQTLYLSSRIGSSVHTVQYCVESSLAMIRVGFLNQGSAACNYSRS